MPFEVTTSDVLAGLALLLSVYATWKTVQTSKSQDLLNKKLLEKEEAEASEAKKADLGATLYKLTSNNYRLKVFNKGLAPARNVKIDFPEGNELISESQAKEKFPLEVLERHQAVELSAMVHLGSKSKHAVKLSWVDDLKAYNEKVVYVTL